MLLNALLSIPYPRCFIKLLLLVVECVCNSDHVFSTISLYSSCPCTGNDPTLANSLAQRP